MKSVRVKVASLKKLGYSYVSADLLINKAKKDFWKVEAKSGNDFVVIRQVADEEFPIQG